MRIKTRESFLLACLDARLWIVLLFAIFLLLSLSIGASSDYEVEIDEIYPPLSERLIPGHTYTFRLKVRYKMGMVGSICYRVRSKRGQELCSGCSGFLSGSGVYEFEEQSFTVPSDCEDVIVEIMVTAFDNYGIRIACFREYKYGEGGGMLDTITTGLVALGGVAASVWILRRVGVGKQVFGRSTQVTTARGARVTSVAKRHAKSLRKTSKKTAAREEAPSRKAGKGILQIINSLAEKYGYDYSLGENLYSIVSDNIITLLEKAAGAHVNRAKYWVKKWSEALDELNDALVAYRKEAGNVKIVGNRVVRLNPRGYLEAYRKYQKALNRVGKARQYAKDYWQKASKALGKAKMLKVIGDMLTLLDVGVDTASGLVRGDTLVHAYSKSATANYILYKVGSKIPGLAKYELITALMFGDSEVGNIVSASNLIKGPIQMAYDAAFKGVKEVYARLKRGDYGLWYKYVSEIPAELKEWVRDPELLMQVLDNKGLGAGLRGEIDNLGEFMDGLHQRVDEVFAVRGRAFRVTKVVVGITKTSLHGLINLGEALIRGTTSLKRWFLW